MFADRVAQNASATSCDMISGKQFLFLFLGFWRKFNAVSKPLMSVFIPFSNDAFSNLPYSSVPWLEVRRNHAFGSISDFADLCGLGSHGFCEACHLTSMTAFGCTWMSTGLCVQGAMRVLAELPGVQVLATYTDIPPLPKQKSSETCRRPIACLLPDVGTIMKERLSMGNIDMDNEAILLRVATLRVTLGLALQKLLLSGLHFPSSELDRLLDKLNSTMVNAGDDVKARLEKCIAHCNRMWMDDRARQRKSLIDLLCRIQEDDDRVQEKRFSQVVALDDILTAPLEVLLRDKDDDLLSLANMLHCSCQGVFKQALKTNPRAAVTAGRIFESAYLWVVACRSCKFSGIEFEGLLVRFQCQDIQPGYIFQKNSKMLDSAKVAEM